jgi:hypothetical protein
MPKGSFECAEAEADNIGLRTPVFKSQQRGSEPDDRPPGGRCAARCAISFSFLFLRARGSLSTTGCTAGWSFPLAGRAFIFS